MILKLLSRTLKSASTVPEMSLARRPQAEKARPTGNYSTTKKGGNSYAERKCITIAWKYPKVKSEKEEGAAAEAAKVRPGTGKRGRAGCITEVNPTPKQEECSFLSTQSQVTNHVYLFVLPDSLGREILPPTPSKVSLRSFFSLFFFTSVTTRSLLFSRSPSFSDVHQPSLVQFTRALWPTPLSLSPAFVQKVSLRGHSLPSHGVLYYQLSPGGASFKKENDFRRFLVQPGRSLGVSWGRRFSSRHDRYHRDPQLCT